MCARVVLALLFAVAASVPMPTAAEPQVPAATVGGPEIVSTRLANGGGTASGDAYMLRSTIGQAEATSVVAGDSFSATLGFRRKREALAEALFADGFE